MTRSAFARRSPSSARSAASPSRMRMPCWSGCGRRELSKRRTRASSDASRNTVRRSTPSCGRPSMTSDTCRKKEPPRASSTTADPVDVGRTAREVDRRLEQRRRHVVDHEPAQVLQRPGGRRPSGTGHAGDQGQPQAVLHLACVVHCRLSAVRRAHHGRSGAPAPSAPPPVAVDGRAGVEGRPDRPAPGPGRSRAPRQAPPRSRRERRAPTRSAAAGPSTSPGRGPGRRRACSTVARLPRRLRCRAIAVRCASSRTRCSR